MQKNLYFASIVAALISLPAAGAPTPIPVALANGNTWLQFQPVAGNNYNAFNYLLGPFPGGYSGAFQPTISPLNASGDGPASTGSQLTTVWCVDYQLDINAGSSYGAKLTSLDNITTPDAGVRYGTLTTVNTTGGWSNALTVPGGSDPNSAATRYVLAAALVSQFDNANGVVDPTHLANDSRNQAIQEAIWYVTFNSQYGSGDWNATGFTAPACSGAFDPNNYRCWVGQAESDLGTVNTSAWAVVSGPIYTSGPNKGNLSDPQNGQYQTFLTQVDTTVFTHENPAPEPGFYGVLTVGLAGLFGVAYRRRARAKLQSQL